MHLKNKTKVKKKKQIKHLKKLKNLKILWTKCIKHIKNEACEKHPKWTQ
jgi:hypothetical protein